MRRDKMPFSKLRVQPNPKGGTGCADVVTSAYRCMKHNAEVGGKDRSPHPLGRGIDIHVIGGQALKVIQLAGKHGFTGVGVNQKGPSKGRFIHLDDMPNELDRYRPWIWTY